MKYFLIAGEASGDIHAAQLITALKELDSAAEFRFLGGEQMQAASGSAPLIHYKDMAFMGFIEVIKHLRQILRFMRSAKATIGSWHADAVILVDYPSFNLKIAEYCHYVGIPTFYYISPKVWAWKEYRVKQIKRFITEMYSILPFEPEFYRRHGYHVEYVGNPTVNEIDEARKGFALIEEFKRTHGIDPKREIIAIIPGSRSKEIEDNLPEMLKAASRFPAYQAVIGGAPGISPEYYQSLLGKCGAEGSVKVLFGCSWELVHHARAALVTSGTATLETAILRTPQVVCYRSNASRLIDTLYPLVLKVRYISLPNLIADAPVVPELLFHHCNASRIAPLLASLLADSPARAAMLTGYATIASRLTTAHSARTAASRLYNHLK